MSGIQHLVRRQQPSLQNSENQLFTLILFGHAAFQYLRAGTELGVFEFLESRASATRDELAEHLGLGERPTKCLLLGLKSLGLIQAEDGRLRNSPVISEWFEQDQWEILKDVVGFEAHIVYPGQQDFVESLKADKNVGLRRIPGQAADLYRRLAETPLQQVFYNYMGSWSRLSLPLLFENYDFSDVRSAVDVGGGEATVACQIAENYPQMNITLLDLPENAQVARRRIEEAQLDGRISVRETDILKHDFPTGHDCFLFIHQMVIWPLDVVTMLLEKAYTALEPGGRVVIFNSITDDDGEGPLMGALDSVYFVSVPVEGGMIYPYGDYEECLRKAGFRDIQRIPCGGWTPHGIVVATKS
ncbi:MAG TPA: methyltransferase [Longimicrobium sp.]|nr:methyltransferase [Longimicrobium sp.]